MASRPSHIVVRDGSTLSPSILKIGSGETAIIGAPQSQVVNLVTPSTAITEAPYQEIKLDVKPVVVYISIMQRIVM